MNMIPTQSPDKEVFKKWHDDPTNWKFGVFYYNKEDKRIFPPKRIRGTGWTINFANPFSLLTVMGLIIIISVIVLFLK